MLIDQKITELELKPSNVMTELKMGIHGVLSKGIIKGVRHKPTDTTNGWYVWEGDKNDSVDFFESRHAEHVISDYSFLAKYLMLPPGYGFIFDHANEHEDIWYDEKLLNG
jgi:hypothetical protein